MKQRVKFFLGTLLLPLLVMLIGISRTSTAQIVTNGSFESSTVGVVSDLSTGTVSSYSVKGWFIQVQAGAAKYEIVNDTVQQGSRAMKVTVKALGGNAWDIQLIADSLPVIPGTIYNYSIWAKAQKPGAVASFTMGNYSYTEYGNQVLRNQALTTQWKKYSWQFTVSDNQTWIRGPIHFSYAADTGNAIYLDNLQIVDVNAPKKPIVVEAESGKVGSNFSTLTSGNITYVTPKTNWTSTGNSGDSSRTIKYQVTFPDSGNYNLFARLRVGSGNYDDDSFFYGNGFGAKNDTSNSDWVFINGLASGGYSDPSAWVDAAGSLGSSVWKWVNVSKNTYSGVPGVVFYVHPDSLTKTFEIASREDGLDIDKVAFGKNWLYYTVQNLDSVQYGSPTMTSTVVDSSLIWKGPALATGMPKFLGSAGDSPITIPNNFANYWTQLTPENAGKWGSVGTSADTTQWKWSSLDNDYNYAINNHLLYKHHTLIWGNQQPSWISSMDTATQRYWIETWIKKVGGRYPKMDMVDVVNEAMIGHNPPDGQNGHANYINALGGEGLTMWNWVIKSFELARQYLPHAKLLINDYGIINNDGNTTSYGQIVGLLKDRGLIDGIGEQGHGFESVRAAIIKSNLDRLAAIGLPIYITEFDLNIQDDIQQKAKYQELFPILWQHPAVKGITLWGYIQGRTWRDYTYLVNTDGTARPALLWLADYIKNNPTGVELQTTGVPTVYQLSQNFPNPFNPVTTIRYSIAKPSSVSLKVFDMLGREVQTLVNTQQAPGQYSVTLNAQNLGSGVYFYRLNAGTFTETKKLMLLK